MIFDYYNRTENENHQTEYHIALGMRSNGKSYQMADMCLKNYLDKGELFVLCRRRFTQMRSLHNYFDVICEKYNVQVDYQEDCFYINKKLAGYCVNVAGADNIKSKRFDDKTTTFVFEEFLPTNPLDYLVDETNLFKSVLSTIFRLRNDVKVWLIANTVSTSSPYFDLFGINLSKLKMKVGSIREIECENSGFFRGAKVTIEITKNVFGSEDSVPYYLRLPRNDIALTGLFEKDPLVVSQSEMLKYKVKWADKLLFYVEKGKKLYAMYYIDEKTLWFSTIRAIADTSQFLLTDNIERRFEMREKNCLFLSNKHLKELLDYFGFGDELIDLFFSDDNAHYDYASIK